MRLGDLDAIRDSLGVSDEDIIFKGILDDAPTIDAVPVVRCYQCKYYAKSMVLCHHEDGLAAPDKMDFCSYGERRGDTDG